MALYPESGKIVEAIEDGRIVKVDENYARREGLVILRNSKQLFATPEAIDKNAKIKQQEINEKRFGIDNFRKPLNKNKNQVLNELVDNFHWQIIAARKARNMTRKQLASSLGVSESVVKLLENGILPTDDFVFINKVQQFFKLNLRKDGKDFSTSPVKSVPPRYKLELDKPKEQNPSKQEPKKEEDPLKDVADDADILVLDD